MVVNIFESLTDNFSIKTGRTVDINTGVTFSGVEEIIAKFISGANEIRGFVGVALKPEKKSLSMKPTRLQLMPP